MSPLRFITASGTKGGLPIASVTVTEKSELQVARISSRRRLVLISGGDQGDLESLDLVLPSDILGAEDEEETIVYFWKDAVKIASVVWDKVKDVVDDGGGGGGGGDGGGKTKIKIKVEVEIETE